MHFKLKLIFACSSSCSKKTFARRRLLCLCSARGENKSPAADVSFCGCVRNGKKASARDSFEFVLLISTEEGDFAYNGLCC